MSESINLDLYYFNQKITEPIVFLQLKYLVKKKKNFLKKIQTLIENEYASFDSIVIF